MGESHEIHFFLRTHRQIAHLFYTQGRNNDYIVVQFKKIIIFSLLIIIVSCVYKKGSFCMHKIHKDNFLKLLSDIALIIFYHKDTLCEDN